MMTLAVFPLGVKAPIPAVIVAVSWTFSFCSTRLSSMGSRALPMVVKGPLPAGKVICTATGT